MCACVYGGSWVATSSRMLLSWCCASPSCVCNFDYLTPPYPHRHATCCLRRRPSTPPVYGRDPCCPQGAIRDLSTYCQHQVVLEPRQGEHKLWYHDGIRVSAEATPGLILTLLSVTTRCVTCQNMLLVSQPHLFHTTYVMSGSRETIR